MDAVGGTLDTLALGVGSHGGLSSDEESASHFSLHDLANIRRQSEKRLRRYSAMGEELRERNRG
jgi:hypothetical protein